MSIWVQSLLSKPPHSSHYWILRVAFLPFSCYNVHCTTATFPNEKCHKEIFFYNRGNTTLILKVTTNRLTLIFEQ